MYVTWFTLNPLNPELNPICYFLALLAHHFLHVSRIRVKSLTLRLLMSYIYIYDISSLRVKLGLRWGWVFKATPQLLYPSGKRSGTHCIRGWVEPQDRSGRVRKISPTPGFDSWTVQPVTNRYTDWAIVAHFILLLQYLCIRAAF